MRRTVRYSGGLVMVVTAFALGCSGTHGSPDGRDIPHVTAAIDHHAPPAASVARATLNLGEPIGSFTLSGGSWNDPASGRRVTLLDQYRLVADLYSDSGQEAVALLDAVVDGTSTTYAVVLDVLDGLPHQIAAAPVGAGLQVTDAAVDGNRVILTVTRPASEGGAGVPAQMELRLRDGAVVVSDL